MILSFWFTEDNLVVETKEEHIEYSLTQFHTWYRLYFPNVCELYIEREEFNVEDEYYFENNINWDELQERITKKEVDKFMDYKLTLDSMEHAIAKFNQL